MKKTILKYLLFLFVLTDLAYSFLQHYNKPLDGDMAGGIVPAEDVKNVLNDPFGISVIKEDAHYPNPNRFFSHWMFKNYFHHAPHALQTFFSPINSIYFSTALIKTGVQSLLLMLMAFYIYGGWAFGRMEFLLALFLVTPLFQTNGWQSEMGIIDSSITYTFFYALPLIFVLLFFIPVYRVFYLGTEIKFPLLNFIFSLLLIPLIALSGPLNPGIVLIISCLLGGYLFFQRNKIDNNVWKQNLWMLISIFLLCVVSIYSLYIGRNNTIFYNNYIPIAERYHRLPFGLYEILTTKMCWSIILSITFLNILQMKLFFKKELSGKLLKFYLWIFLFCLLYLLLLPLGGYKVYRPLIIRYDTFIPVTLGIAYVFITSSIFVLKRSKNWIFTAQILILFSYQFIFSVHDKPEFDKNDCERGSLKAIAESDDSSVILPCSCTVISWNIIDQEESSLLVGKLLYQWNLTKEVKTFRQAH